MKKILGFFLLVLALVGPSKVHADILSVTCRSGTAASWIINVQGGPTDQVDVQRRSYDTALSRANTCLVPALHVCPAGTVDVGVTDRVECTDQSQACTQRTNGNQNCSTLDPASWSDGQCCKVTCKLVKSCIVPGA